MSRQWPENCSLFSCVVASSRREQTPREAILQGELMCPAGKYREFLPDSRHRVGPKKDVLSGLPARVGTVSYTTIGMVLCHLPYCSVSILAPGLQQTGFPSSQNQFELQASGFKVVAE